MSISTLPTHRRPRESLIKQGPEKVSLKQLLTVLLGSGCLGMPVDALSGAVESLFLRGNVTIHNLLEIPGIGIAKATIICAALELGRRMAQTDCREPFTSPFDIYISCKDLCRLPQENLAVFYVNSRNQVIEREIVTIGTVSASLIHPREVFREAVVHNSSGIVLAHNHPSGSSEPSKADLEATRQIFKAGAILGISLIDHVICAERGFTSLREREPQLFLADP